MLSLVLAYCAAFGITVGTTALLLPMLTRLGARQTVSENAPASHAGKQGTPTMGGLFILIGVLAPAAFWFMVTQPGMHRSAERDYVAPTVLLTMLYFGAIGFIDDLLIVRRGRNLGLKARQKFAMQCVGAVLFVVWLSATGRAGYTTWITVLPPAAHLPIGPLVINLGFWFFPLAAIYLVGMSNAANITDGLDGLLAGIAMIIALALAWQLSGSPEPALGVVAAFVAGSCGGFLWWNCHPARLFMGDTGSLALGGVLASLALAGKQETGLAVASLVLWAELISVILQVGVFQWRKRRYGAQYASDHRLLRRSPLHHHLEELGCPETAVVQRLWLLAALCGSASLLWRLAG
ncbi:MAG: phospho-N-acetylmuramoyl-pentapeptide-transferase [Armatimonadetes bacterium]|nr:phospho-N-acetylmuramoyl-pentapeptide-transferase [Armatimonadota bacterium]MDE2205216.1 phospho-N-acetylmuramoyl-pentapeptide-transferase [Armatimonadota bacterium]